MHSRRDHHAQCRRGAQLVMLVFVAGTAAAESFELGRKTAQTVIARAERAWQSEQGDVMHFKGALELRGERWRVNADRALIEGHLADPERVIVQGAPARITVGAADDPEPVEGFSQHLEFEPRNQIVRLEGAATIIKGGQSITSESIRYLLERNTFAAGSRGRVKVVTKPRTEKR
jgi:lipopolysaccharide transport protein LptA